MRWEIGEEQMMRVRHDEAVANHILKHPNDAGSPVEEGVRPRAGIEENVAEDRTRRTLNR